MMDQRLAITVAAALVILTLYRRVRRNIGRQSLRPRRMQLRVFSLVVAGVLLATNAAHDVRLIGAFLLGTLAGAALGQLGLRHTKFEASAEGNFYTPHTYIGVAIAALLVGRLAYRFTVLYPASAAAMQASQDPLAAYQMSPLTLAIVGLVIGYYLAYYVGVLIKSKALQASATPV